jgi:hypothetical protein
LDSWTNPILGFAERQNFSTLGPTATPPRRERHYGTILTDQRSDNSESALNVAELDQGATGRKNQLSMRRESRHLFSSYCKAIAGVEERAIDIAEKGNSRELNSARSIRAHGP